MDNYEKAALGAKKLFLSRDPEALRKKFRLSGDETYLYLRFMGVPHRLSKKTGDLERQEGNTWVSANSFDEVLTLLDILCDAKEDRCLSGFWQSTQNFGQMFHRDLLENTADPMADFFDAHPEELNRACETLGARRLSYADVSWAVPVLGELELGLFFWHGDEDFPAQLRFFWDENALQYLKYETMHYAIGVLRAALSRLCGLQK